jgi:predicted TIM-barrel fold metal-dependent hydrolase
VGGAGPAHRRRAGGLALFLRHPDRFLVGTDTWVTSRWESVRDASEAVQRWLQQLPREVAEQIAWKTGERLFPPP